MKQLPQSRPAAIDPGETSQDLLAASRRGVIRFFSLATGGFVLLLLLTGPLREEPVGVTLGYAGLLSVFVASYFLREKHLTLAGALCSLGPFALVTQLTAAHGGITSPPGVAAYVTLVALTGLFWDGRGALLIAALSSATVGWFLKQAQNALPMPKLQVWLELSFQFFLIAALAGVALKVVARAAAARVAHQEAVKAVQRRIEESHSTEALGRLTGGVAHDFNNLLTVILGTIKILETSSEALPEMKRELRRLEDAADKAVNLTSQLLSIGRNHPRTPKVINPERTLQALVPLLRRLLPVGVRLELSCEEPGNILIDESRLDQALINLVTNASHATGGRGRIRVSAKSAPASDPELEEPTRWVELSVTDDGEGITDDVKERMFEPYFTTKPGGVGTGLGLVMVKSLVEQSGGELIVESQPRSGACFRLRFPEVSSSVVPPASDPLVSTLPSPKSLLLVEPDEDVRSTLSRLLRGLGHQVTAASGLLDLEQILEEETQLYDGLITALALRDGTAAEVVDAARLRHPDLAVLYVGGSPLDDHSPHLGRGPREARIEKPLSGQRLHDSLQSLLTSGEALGADAELDRP